MLHELGHALGLGGSTDPASPMYETLAAGVADRTVTTQDLNIPDPPEGADPQMAAGLRPAIRPGGPTTAPAQDTATTFMMPLDNSPAVRDGAISDRASSRVAATRRISIHRDPVAGSSSGIANIAGASRRLVLQAGHVDAVLAEIGRPRSPLAPRG